MKKMCWLAALVLASACADGHQTTRSDAASPSMGAASIGCADSATLRQRAADSRRQIGETSSDQERILRASRANALASLALVADLRCKVTRADVDTALKPALDAVRAAESTASMYEAIARWNEADFQATEIVQSLSQQLPAQAGAIVAAASKFVPGVTWRPGSVLTADFSCRGHDEQAILGLTAKEIIIALFLNGPTEKPEVLRYSAAVRDANEASLTLESQDYAPSEDTSTLPGFKRSKTCQGLNLSDEKIDSAHIYWNHDARRFDDWVR